MDGHLEFLPSLLGTPRPVLALRGSVLGAGVPSARRGSLQSTDTQLFCGVAGATPHGVAAAAGAATAAYVAGATCAVLLRCAVRLLASPSAACAARGGVTLPEPACRSRSRMSGPVPQSLRAAAAAGLGYGSQYPPSSRPCSTNAGGSTSAGAPPSPLSSSAAAAAATPAVPGSEAPSSAWGGFGSAPPGGLAATLDLPGPTALGAPAGWPGTTDTAAAASGAGAPAGRQAEVAPGSAHIAAAVGLAGSVSGSGSGGGGASTGRPAAGRPAALAVSPEVLGPGSVGDGCVLRACAGQGRGAACAPGVSALGP
jgi:hypothetical protein